MYEESARSLGLKTDDVRNHLHYARARLQQLIVRDVSEYSEGPEELSREVRGLFRPLE